MEHDELTDYLCAIDRDDAYRVDRVLKRAPAELTELVYFRGRNGAEMGPFVRKRIARASNLGGVYERIREAQRAGRRFLHLPRILEAFKTEHELVVVSEYVSGLPLSRVVERHRAGAPLAVKVFPAICDAVSELHEAFDPPIIHRDLTPGNIIVTDACGTLTVTLIDFGISRVYRAEAHRDTTHYGTLPFAPPEQFGYGQTDVRSDVYALGGLLHLCLTGEIPPPSGPQREAGPRLAPSAELRAVVLRAMSFDPQGRYASVAAMRAAFLRACGAPAPPPPPSPGSRAPARASAAPAMPAPELAAPATAALAPPAPQRGERWQTLGRIWNGLLAVTLLVLTASLTVAVWVPGAQNQDIPLWYRALIACGFALPDFFGIGYLLLDKRRLRRRFPLLARRTWRGDLIAVGILLAVTLLVTVAAYPLTGR